MPRNIINYGGNGKISLIARPDMTDPDAISYVNLVQAADNQSLERSTRLAIDAFVKGCKSDNTWNSIKSCCILSGARTLTGALIPLKGTAPTNNNFVQQDYSRSLGLLGADGKYLNSNRLTNTISQNSGHLYVRLSAMSANTTLNRAYIGSVVNVNSDISLIRRLPNSATIEAYMNSPFGNSYDLGIKTGSIGIARSSSTIELLKTNDSVTFSNSQSYAHNNINIYVFCLNNNGTPSEYAIDERIAFYCIGDYLNFTGNFRSRINSLMSAFSSLA